MEDRATTTPDLEEDPDATDEPLASSVAEGLPEDTHSVDAAPVGVDPDTAEGIGEAELVSTDTSELEVSSAAAAVAVSVAPVADDKDAASEAEAEAEPEAAEPEPEEAEAEPEEAEAESEAELEEAEAESEPEEAEAEAEEAEPEPEDAEPETEEAEAAEAQEAEAEPAAEAAEGEEDAEEEQEEAAPAGPASPYDLPGDWYVIHSYSGYENKVKVNLETRTHSMHMEGEIFDVVIPMEDVVEIKGGRKVTVPKKVFPGYILVRMYMSDDSWFGVRNTPGVTGFVGSGTKPTPLSRREVERILGVEKPEDGGEKAAPRFKPAWDVGETVRVVDGPFADFNGAIEEINLDQSKVRVLVNIFGRDTPVELNFEQIVKL